MKIIIIFQSPCYVVKCMLLLQLISRTTGAGCSVDHGSGMNYPTTTASGTWTTRGGISSYGWDSQQPIDPCSRCTNTPPPLPGSQYTTHIHDNNYYNPNDRISSISGFISDNRGNGYSPGGSGYSSNSNRGNVQYNVNNRPNNNYNSNGQIGNGGYISNNNYVNDNRVNGYIGYNADNKIKNPNYRGNGYDNMSPEWERRHNNKKGSSGGYYQGMSYPVPNVPDEQGIQAQGNYYHRPSNDRWNIKGAHPVKIDSGFWHSQPPKDIGWDEDSKRVGVIAGWIGGPKKYESGKPLQTYGSHQANDKNDDHFYKGTGYDDQKKPYMGWGGSGSYEVVKMNTGYKYIDRNSNGDYGTANYGNNYGYGGQSYNYNSKPVQDYGSKPMNVGHDSRPNNQGTSNYDKSPIDIYDKPYIHGYNKPPTQGYDDKQTHDYGSRPSMGWSMPRPIGFEITPSRPTKWDSQRPGHPVIASRPTQHWGENSFSELSSGSGSMGYNRPGAIDMVRPHDYGLSRPSDYGSSRPESYGSSRPDNYGSSRPDGYGSSKPVYGIQGTGEGGRPYVGSIHHNSINMVSEYGSQRPDFDKFAGYSDNSAFGDRPQANDRPSYDNGRPFVNGNDIYGSQQQTGSGNEKGYASNWDYYSNSMR